MPFSLSEIIVHVLFGSYANPSLWYSIGICLIAIHVVEVAIRGPKRQCKTETFWVSMLCWQAMLFVYINRVRPGT